MYYVTDENENRVDLETALSPYDYALKTEEVSAVGITTVIDGIECYGLNGTVNKITTWLNKTRYAGKGSAIFVDKNHDLSYYVNGSDYVDSDDYDISPGTFGYEWGGYGKATNIKDADIGSGLSNTNSLIAKNLQPNTSGWYVVWDKIKEFRQSHSDNWFLPSKGELNLIYEAKANLNNLSTSKNYYYWSSSENGSYTTWGQSFSNGMQSNQHNKEGHDNRTRLCRHY